MSGQLADVIAYILARRDVRDKSVLARQVAAEFDLTQDRSVYYSPRFAIRFSSSNTANFGNTVLSLSNLQKVDDRPFMVCLVTPGRVYLLLANTSFIKKISHSSHTLRENNIRGSFNGSDIIRIFNGIQNVPDNFARLFEIHAMLGFEGNLARLVEATNGISPTGHKFAINDLSLQTILGAPSRAAEFSSAEEYFSLKLELDGRAKEYKNEILMAALIENVNVRGRAIEYLIAGEDQQLRAELIEALKSGRTDLPSLRTTNALGDYLRNFAKYTTATDVKTKIMVLSSNPKGYNLDKLLAFLAVPKSVFLIYFVRLQIDYVEPGTLVSVFQKDLLDATLIIKHWAGRNSRGVTQFEGNRVARLLEQGGNEIDQTSASAFLERVIAL